MEIRRLTAASVAGGRVRAGSLGLRDVIVRHSNWEDAVDAPLAAGAPLKTWYRVIEAAGGSYDRARVDIGGGGGCGEGFQERSQER